MHHLLSVDHIEKTTSKYDERVGYSIPQWKARFRSIPTGEGGHLFTYDEFDIWPNFCSECNCDLSNTQHSGCNVCRAKNPQAPRPDNTDRCEDSGASNDGGKRPRTASSPTADEEGRGTAATIPALRSPYLDFRGRHQNRTVIRGSTAKDHSRSAGVGNTAR